MCEDLALATFFARLELHLAAQRLDDSWQVTDTSDGRLFTGQCCSSYGGGGYGLCRGDGEARRDTGAHVDGGGLAHHPRVTREHLDEVVRQQRGHGVGSPVQQRFLLD